MLSTCPLFEKISSSSTSDSPTHGSGSSTSPTLWKYVPLPPADTPPLVKSLENLRSALPKDIKSRKSPLQHTLQTMSDFTGYISTQVYLPYRSPPSGMGIPSSTGLNSVEEDMKKEIRALKGLVLNRYVSYACWWSGVLTEDYLDARSCHHYPEIRHPPHGLPLDCTFSIKYKTLL